MILQGKIKQNKNFACYSWFRYKNNPSSANINSCENECVSPFLKSILISEANHLRWYLFKPFKNTTTSVGIEQHITRTHIQCHVCCPVKLNISNLGWIREFTPIMTTIAIAPDALVKLIMCNCGKVKVMRIKCNNQVPVDVENIKRFFAMNFCDTS